MAASGCVCYSREPLLAVDLFDSVSVLGFDLLMSKAAFANRYFARPTCLDRFNHARQGRGKGGNRTTPNSNYENVWRVLKERLDESAVRLKSQYSTRLYLWAKQYSVVGYKWVSLATPRKVLGLEAIKDNSGRVVHEASLDLWANLKQRALEVALKEIDNGSDIQLELEFIGRGVSRKVLSLGFRIGASKNARGKGAAWRSL